MTNKLFIKPAVEGSVVRQPDRAMKPLDAAGEWVVDNEFWQRRLLLKDVVEAKPPKEPKAEPAKE
jgi:hypothetical protein